MRTLRFLAVAVLTTTTLTAQTVIPVARFQSIELHDGGEVIVRHGTTQRVTILSGNARSTRVRADGERLVIDNCRPDCPRDYHLRMEIITPGISALSVSDGGILRSAGAFPVQAAISAAVEQGGTLDIRSMAADAVTASVDSGGRIFTHPRQTLTAAIESGGVITYWGDVRVRKAVRDGGIVTRGTAAAADRPLSELNPPLPAIPPIPPLPAIQPVGTEPKPPMAEPQSKPSNVCDRCFGVR